MPAGRDQPSATAARPWLWIALLAISLAAPSLAVAQVTDGDKALSEPLATRGQVRAITRDNAGKTTIALKILPRTKLPFSTLTFRVRDLGLVNGFAAGDEVFFVAAQVDGENTLQALRKTTPCIKFQPCPLHD